MASAIKPAIVVDVLPVDLVLSWRWRCQSKGTIVPGPDLCLAGFPKMFRLSEYIATEVEPTNLRCACGGEVIALAPFR
jgi:hypothetical protein